MTKMSLPLSHSLVTKESKDIREPNKVKSIQPLIFHFLMFKVRNAGCEYTDFFNFSRGNFWCIPCLDIQLNSTLQPAITKFFCCLVCSPIYKASLCAPKNKLDKIEPCKQPCCSVTHGRNGTLDRREDVMIQGFMKRQFFD